MSMVEVPALAVAGVTKVYADGFKAVRDLDVEALRRADLAGGYRRELGWGAGRRLGAHTAVGPAYPE